MLIGIPKEIMQGENRVSATPSTVKTMVELGWQVLVEKDAGLGSHMSNQDYIEAGADLIENVEELFERSDIILKVKEPLFNETLNKHEVDLMHAGQYLITFIHPASPVNHDMVKHMAERGIISITLDGIPRISRAQNMDALTSMSTCAGYKGILMGANELPRFAPQMFTAIGMIKPINGLVIGVGVGGLQAIATLKRLGAVTYATDIRPDACEQATSLGARVIDLNVPAAEAVGEGGYALSLSQERLDEERTILAEHIKDADIVFLSALVPGKIAPILVTKEMVASMKSGSVIIDISIDQGGNCEATVPGEIVKVDDVTIIGVKNIPGMLPESSTSMFAFNVLNLLKYLIKDGQVSLDFGDEIIQKSLTTYDGKVVHEGAKEAMGLA
ncbi:MAG: NAD(P) transhydrogenase subunit alpha [Clostridiales bacterium]|nr:NAD(P) transhydrogenase subunit alpha [Clostridiales bacterium]